MKDYMAAWDQLRALQEFVSRIHELMAEGWSEHDAEQIATDEANIRRGVALDRTSDDA